MKRGHFLRSLFTGALVAAAVPTLLAKDSKLEAKYSFDDLFIIHKGNDRLIYPKKESLVYKKIEETFEQRINKKASCTYLPENKISIPVKKEYSYDDFMTVQYYFDCVYTSRQKFAIGVNNVCFRFIKDKPDRMYLEVFIDNHYVY